MPKPFSTAGLSQDKVKKEVEIKVLEKEFEPSKFPHRRLYVNWSRFPTTAKWQLISMGTCRPSARDAIIEALPKPRHRRIRHRIAGIVI